MQSLLGVLFHTLGGLASGSFYIPYNRIRVWAWAVSYTHLTLPTICSV